MLKSPWRLALDEIEREGWTVTRSVRIRRDGTVTHIAAARRGHHVCLVEEQNETRALRRLREDTRAIG
jgi:hypothetical protein